MLSATTPWRVELGNAQNYSWRRSSRCDTGSCVEVAMMDDGVAVRDSKQPDGPVLRFTKSEWTAFVAGVDNGEFGIK
jgi:hypothetical protein